ncbi:MAG TPA: hypothetical protein VKU84_04480, partial [Stellaceae bacterium]|nr:hypothetical protein [Stellaceae bacterium]
MAGSATLQALSAVELLDWVVSRRIHEYLDEAGRPIGEGRSAAFRDIETEMQSCPYTGSRHHHAKPMNVSALRQMPPWRHVLAMLSWLSHRYRAAHQRDVRTANDLAQ